MGGKHISCNTIVTILDGVFFIGLCSAAVAFIWQALIQYRSKDTSFKRAEVPIGTIFPTFSFCLIPNDDDIPQADWGPPYEHILGRDFNFTYYVSGTWFPITSEGSTFVNVTEETLNVQMVATIYICYKVNSTAKVRNGYFRGIKIEFDKSIPVEKLPTNIEFYLTSEDNAYSILFGKKMNGKVLKRKHKLGDWAALSIRGQKFVYLPETSECTDLSFWKLWESHYSHYSGFDKCPRKCSAITLPQNR